MCCHPSGRSYRIYNWDIPKGHVEEGETHVQTALRELKEETGLILKPDDLYDCGLFLYTKYKDLHLYVAETDVNINNLKCSTYFSFEGRFPPEIDSYKFVPIGTYDVFFKSLGPLVKTCLERYLSEKNKAVEDEYRRI